MKILKEEKMVVLDNGTKLNLFELGEICLAFERLYTMEYIIDNYNINDYNKAYDIATKVREQMEIFSCDGGNEEIYTEDIMSEYGISKRAE